jgi:histone arginine demethylase JMJD6
MSTSIGHDKILKEGTQFSQFPQVDRRSGLSLREFQKDYLYPGKPVVITDAIEAWPARSRWTMDYFKSRYAETLVTVYRLGGERYDAAGTEMMKLSLFIDRIQTSSFETYPHYVRDDWQLFLNHKELLSDYQVPEYFFDWFVFLPGFMRLIYPRIFIGPKGAITPLHLDIWGTHAWLAQLIGRKRWILFSPDQRELLYDCNVQPQNPDLQRFPLFRKSRPVECTIGPGDLIFVPGGWAHEVVSLDATISITHNYMGPGCFASSFSGSVKDQVFNRLRRRTS